MKLNNKQKLLFEFVKTKHKDQVRKYTYEPYHTHLLSVAEIVSIYETGCVEIALCHDLFEDTNCTFNELYKKLSEIGYDMHTSYDICTCVKELTDVFTKEDYPHLNRAKRKENEANRLGKIRSISQSVKYADLIDNTISIFEHGKDFTEIYLKEKDAILKVMNKGNQSLFKLAFTLTDSSELPSNKPKSVFKDTINN